MPPTVRDIARVAKVVPSTVSLVLNRSDRVSAQTRLRVENAIKQLGYKHRSAEDAANHKPKALLSIAIIYSQSVMLNGQVFPLAMSWMTAMRRRAAELGHHVSIFACMPNVEQDLVYQEMLKKGELHGAIFIGTALDNSYLECAGAQNLPVVVMNRTPRHHEFSYVSMDNYQGGHVAAEYLYNLGHRRMAVLVKDDAAHFWAERRAGFEDFLAGQSLKPVCSLAHNSHEELPGLCRQIVDSGATAVFIHGDEVAMHCLNIFDDSGIRVPEQMSVIGFDDVDLKSRKGLRPTSIGYDKEKMGTAAVDMLAELIGDQVDTRNMARMMSVSIVPHDTTAIYASD